MKDMFVKKDSEFKIHQSVLFLDKNVENYKGEKLILSLGYDNKVDEGNGKILETALVFKIWNFMSLGGKYQFFLNSFFKDYKTFNRENPASLTGGNIWEK